MTINHIYNTKNSYRYDNTIRKVNTALENNFSKIANKEFKPKSNMKYIEIFKNKNYIIIGRELYGFFRHFAFIYVFWIIVHNVSANLYVYFCAQSSMWGIISSIFTTQSPHCTALRIGMETGVGIINSMWGTLGVWISSKLLN
jgi:hypothetical protein